MPIADSTLQAWTGKRFPQAARWMVITDHEVREAWKRKGVRLLCYFCWAISLACLLYFYFAANYETLSKIELLRDISRGITIHNALVIDENTYYGWLIGWHSIPICFAVFLAMLTGSGCISRDIKNQALPLYLCRAFGVWDYILGKGASIALYVSSVTLIPTVVLFFCNAFFREDWSLLWRQSSILMAIAGYGLVFVVSLTLLVLTCSSLYKSGRLASLSVIGFYYVSNIMSILLKTSLTAYSEAQGFETFGKWDWISLNNVWICIAAKFFGRSIDMDIGFGTAVLTLTVMCVLCLYILRRRVRAFEVMK